MMPPAEKKTTTLLFNPFVYIAGKEALALGIVAILFAGWIGTLGEVHFDGVLDAHGGPIRSWGRVFAEGLVDWLCAGAVFYLVGRIFSRTSFRALDLFGTQALARWPTVLTSLVLYPAAFRRYGNKMVAQMRNGSMNLGGTDAPYFWMAIVLTLVLTVWMVVLMYRSYSVSCNLKGARGVWTFIGGLIIAEMVSKVAIWALVKLG